MPHNMGTTQYIRRALGRAGYKGSNLILRQTTLTSGYVVSDAGSGKAIVRFRPGDHVPESRFDELASDYADEYEEVIRATGAYVERDGNRLYVWRTKPEWKD